VQTPPAICVIIAHLNQPAPLRRCLEALRAQDFDMSGVEIIVVDNGSRSLPQVAAAGACAVVLAEEGTPGPGPARNRGVALTRAPILAFTDADCLPAPDWLSAIHARFAADPGLDILGGDVRIVTDPAGPLSPAEAFQILFAYRQEFYIARRNFSVTANLAVRREVFAAVGPFAGLDTAEDFDWGQRATRSGRRIVYAAESRVLHPARPSMAELRAIWDRHVTHLYNRRAAGLRGRIDWLVRIALVAASPVLEIPTVLFSRRVRGARARWLAFRGLVDIRLYRALRMAGLLVGGPDGAARWNRG